jgi:hypothetical protein
MLTCGRMYNGTKECAMPDNPGGGCWHWPGKPPALQLSDVPEEDDSSVQYWAWGM